MHTHFYVLASYFVLWESIIKSYLGEDKELQSIPPNDQLHLLQDIDRSSVVQAR